jgi:hypothetical protein
MSGHHDHERRRHRRFVLRLPATLYVGAQDEPQRGHLLDISESGASITGPLPVPVHTGAYLRYRLEPSTSCEATGAVVRSAHFGHEWGIAIDLTYANQPFINFLRNLGAVHEAERPALLADIRDLQVHFG